MWQQVVDAVERVECKVVVRAFIQTFEDFVGGLVVL